MPLKAVDDPTPLGPKLNDIAGMLRRLAEKIDAGDPAFADLSSVVMVRLDTRNEVQGFMVIGNPLNRLESKGVVVDILTYLEQFDGMDTTRHPAA